MILETLDINIKIFEVILPENSTFSVLNVDL